MLGNGVLRLFVQGPDYLSFSPVGPFSAVLTLFDYLHHCIFSHVVVRVLIVCPCCLRHSFAFPSIHNRNI